VEERIRGWLPKEPSIPSNQGTKLVEIIEKDRQRKTFKISSAANAIMLGTFLGLHFLVDPFNSNVELTIISWIIFILTLVSVNLLIYRYFKVQTNSQKEDLKS
jgi:hypothetical protein